MTITLLVTGIFMALITSVVAKRDWLAPFMSSIVFILYGIVEGDKSLYLALLAALIQLVAAYKMYKKR